MKNPVDEAIGKMLMALGGKPEPERIVSFTDALDDAHLCHECGAKAARQLSATMKRRPFPGDLVDITRQVQESADHQSHVSDRMALGSDELRVWWSGQAPVHVRKVWPELSGVQAVDVAARIASFGWVPPDPDAIAVELGYVDEYGPTPERQWWLDNYPDLTPTYVDRAVPAGDR